MKIIYLLKKGLQCYPPCLSQVLILNDLKYDVEVFHGNNSSYIDKMLDERGIAHHVFKTDKKSKNKIESAVNFALFGLEARRTQSSLDSDAVIWIGNMETAMSLNIKKIRNRSIILNVLELYNEHTMYDRWLAKNIKYVDIVVSCENHRSAIMQSRYSLSEKPEVIPNKPYEINYECDSFDDDLINLIKDSFTVVYQGMISKDRPLENVAKALSSLGDDRIVFLVMGECSEHYKAELKRFYPNTLFTGYVPAPQHLYYTQYCNIGIANYDTSSLNNVFCAPNKIYEYSKFGIPMLCSLNIALLESVGESNAGFCVDFSNLKEIENSILKIKNDYKRYSVNAHSFYSKVNIEEKIKIIVEKIGRIK